MFPASRVLLLGLLAAVLLAAAAGPVSEAHARNPFVQGQGQGESGRNATAPAQDSFLAKELAPYLSPVLRQLSMAQNVLKKRLVAFGESMHAVPFGPHDRYLRSPHRDGWAGGVPR